MSTIKNISLFVPKVFLNFNQDYVAKAFAELGDVERVDFVAKQDRDGKLYNAAYIHFRSWYDNYAANKTMSRIETAGKTEFYHDDSEYYWIVLPNTAKKHVSGERKPCLDLGEAKVVNMKAVEKPVKEVVCPGAPKKPTYAEIAEQREIEYERERQEKISYSLNEKCHNDSAKIKNISRIILESQDELSDGFGYYASDVDKTLEKIAKKILKSVDEQVEEFMPCSIEEAEMAEIEAELEAEDANLVSIDGRYVQTIEQENMYLHGEVAQLRAALINLDMMYRTEAAKVTAMVQNTNSAKNGLL